MFASLVQGPLLRLFLVGAVLLALQSTVFADLRPAGDQPAGRPRAGGGRRRGGGPQKGALAGFVLGLLYDLHIGTPLGSSSISMGLAGFLAGYVTAITMRPPWWLAAVFAALGAAAGEAAVPIIRAFVGEEHPLGLALRGAIVVVAIGAMVLSPLLVPVGRWCMRVKQPEWKAPREEV